MINIENKEKHRPTQVTAFFPVALSTTIASLMGIITEAIPKKFLERRAPLDKTECAVKGELILYSAEAPPVR